MFKLNRNFKVKKKYFQIEIEFNILKLYCFQLFLLLLLISVLEIQIPFSNSVLLNSDLVCAGTKYIYYFIKQITAQISTVPPAVMYYSADL